MLYGILSELLTMRSCANTSFLCNFSIPLIIPVLNNLQEISGSEFFYFSDCAPLKCFWFIIFLKQFQIVFGFSDVEYNFGLFRRLDKVICPTIRRHTSPCYVIFHLLMLFTRLFFHQWLEIELTNSRWQTCCAMTALNFSMLVPRWSHSDQTNESNEWTVPFKYLTGSFRLKQVNSLWFLHVLPNWL